MPDDKVTIDPGFRSPQQGRDGRGGFGLTWIGIGVIVVMAGVLGWLLRSPGHGTSDSAGSDVGAATTTTFALVVPSTSASGLPVISVPLREVGSDMPLGAVVPGFGDTITTLTWRRDGVDLLRWRPSQPAPETAVSFHHNDGGWNRGVDASGRLYVEMRADAVLTIRAVSDGGDLTRGPVVFEEAGDGRRWSAVWHDTQPGRLAWLACPADDPGVITTVQTTDGGGPAAEPGALALVDFGCDDPGVRLAGWGDWGLLLHATEGSEPVEILLDDQGAEVARGRLGPDGEWFVGAGPKDTTIWTQGPERSGATSFLLSSDGLERMAVPGLAPDERLEGALASPDGSYLALVLDLAANSGSLVRVVEADTGAVVAEIPDPSYWVSRMVWSSDGRFLVYERWPDIPSNWAGVPHDAELAFYDTEVGAGLALPLPAYSAALRSGAR